MTTHCTCIHERIRLVPSNRGLLQLAATIGHFIRRIDEKHLDSDFAHTFYSLYLLCGTHSIILSIAEKFTSFASSFASMPA